MVEGSGDSGTYLGAIHDLLDIFEDRHPQHNRKTVLRTGKLANLELARGESFDVIFNSPLFFANESLQQFMFTQSVFTLWDVVITRKDQEFEYRKPQDLYGKNVGTIRGYGYGNLMKFLFQR